MFHGEDVNTQGVSAEEKADKARIRSLVETTDTRLRRSPLRTDAPNVHVFGHAPKASEESVHSGVRTHNAWIAQDVLTNSL